MPKFNRDLPVFTASYGDDKRSPDYPRPRPAHPAALALAEALVGLLEATNKLEAARVADGDGGGYTGQFENGHFIRIEVDAYNRATEVYADAVCAVVAAGASTV